MLTIGQLAQRAGATPSMLRFYEREGLLGAAQRSAAGYRLYPPASERQVLFIRRAQRLGFSLADIRALLEEVGRQAPRPGASRGRRGSGRATGGVAGGVRDLAEQRALDIERRLTELLVLRHELELFLEDLAGEVAQSGGASAIRMYRDLLDHVCGHGPARAPASSLERMMGRLGCSLAGADGSRLLEALRGRHVHVWKEDDGYAVLVAGHEPSAQAALERLVASESGCAAHVDVRLEASTEGVLLKARGANAFLFAQLFLTLESADAQSARHIHEDGSTRRADRP
ncbi:MAG: MerR family DNA-binding transcriptional regulator [Burkholderiales bacterium]